MSASLDESGAPPSTAAGTPSPAGTTSRRPPGSLSWKRAATPSTPVRGRHRARGHPCRRGQLRRGRADHDPPARRRGRDARRPRALAADVPRRPVHARVRRHHALRHPPDRRARCAGRVDHRAARPRDDGLRRRRGGRRPRSPRRVRRVRVPRRADRRERRELRAVAGQRGDLPARGRPPRVGERFVQRDLAATIQHMVDEERSAAGGGREAGLEGRARRSTSATSRARSPSTRPTTAAT